MLAAWKELAVPTTPVDAVFWLITLVLGVLGGHFLPKVWRRYERPPGPALDWRVSITPVLTRTAPRELGVTYHARPVSDPHVVQLTLGNYGSAALQISAYDVDQQALQATFGDARLVALLDAGDGSAAISLDGSTAWLGPQRLPSGASWRYSLLTSGRPAEVRIDGANVADTLVGPDPRQGSARRIQLVLQTGGLIVLLAAVVIVLVAAAVGGLPAQLLLRLILGATGVGFGLIMIGSIVDVAISRAARRRQKRLSLLEEPRTRTSKDRSR